MGFPLSLRTMAGWMYVAYGARGCRQQDRVEGEAVFVVHPCYGLKSRRERSCRGS
jgi:hypothetical protein